MSALVDAIIRIVDLIIRWVAEGASDDEILARLRAPGSVGRQLIAAVRARQSALDDYVNRG